MLVGVLALQGDFQTHEEALREIGLETVEVRRAEDAGFLNPAEGRKGALEDANARKVRMRPPVDALVLPGGESSTFDLLGRRYGLDRLVAAYAASGKTLLGTCAGAIWLGKGEHHRVKPLGLLDVVLERNAYGRQVDSFIAPITVAGLEEPFEAVFIRAPKMIAIGPGVEVLAEYEGSPVFVRQGNLWAATFHPERTPDRRIHEMVFKAAGG